MHHLVQRGKVRSQVINVPKGLPELLSDIAREVLRCQPTSECLCQFIIDYLNSLIVTQHKATLAKSVIDKALRIVDDAIADMCVCDISKEKADYMCEAMEECFRRFLAQRRCEKSKNKELIKFNELDILDELVQKCKFTDRELKITKPIIEDAYQKFVNAYMTAKDSSEGTDSLYQYFRERELIRLEERLREESAVKIQSYFRGFLLRRSLFTDEPLQKPISSIVETEYDKMQLERAAVKIQQFFRRHLKNIDIGEGDEEVDEQVDEQIQDPCTPASNISLTAHSAGPYDTSEKNYDTNKTQDDKNQDLQMQNEFIPDKQDDHIIDDEQSRLSITKEVDAEAELQIENATEQDQNE